MIVKGFILFALLVCITESAPMDAMTRRDMSLLKQLLQVAQLQQEEGGAPAYKQNADEEGDRDTSVAEIEMLLKAQGEDSTDEDLQGILGAYPDIASMQRWRNFWGNFRDGFRRATPLIRHIIRAINNAPTLPPVSRG